MKKIWLIICCLLMVQTLLGCNKQKEELQQPTNFYYITKEISYNTPDGVICAEEREAVNFSGDLTALMEEYLKGPNTPDMQTVIPLSAKLVSCTISDNTVNLTMSNPFAKLSGVKLSTACSAILMTIYDYSGVEELRICVEDGLLDEKKEIVLSIDDILLMDNILFEGGFGE